MTSPHEREILIGKLFHYTDVMTLQRSSASSYHLITSNPMYPVARGDHLIGSSRDTINSPTLINSLYHHPRLVLLLLPPGLDSLS